MPGRTQEPRHRSLLGWRWSRGSGGTPNLTAEIEIAEGGLSPLVFAAERGHARLFAYLLSASLPDSYFTPTESQVRTVDEQRALDECSFHCRRIIEEHVTGVPLKCGGCRCLLDRVPRVTRLPPLAYHGSCRHTPPQDVPRRLRSILILPPLRLVVSFPSGFMPTAPPISLPVVAYRRKLRFSSRPSSLRSRLRSLCVPSSSMLFLPARLVSASASTVGGRLRSHLPLLTDLTHACPLSSRVALADPRSLRALSSSL